MSSVRNCRYCFVSFPNKSLLYQHINNTESCKEQHSLRRRSNVRRDTVRREPVRRVNPEPLRRPFRRVINPEPAAIVEENESGEEIIRQPIRRRIELLPVHIKNTVYDFNINNGIDFTCPICLLTPSKENLGITKCGHNFCKTCIQELEKQDAIRCPICRTEL